MREPFRFRANWEGSMEGGYKAESALHLFIELNDDLALVHAHVKLDLGGAIPWHVDLEGMWAGA